MTDNEDIDALAGEYVIGTLDAEERTMVAARRLREPDLDNAILAWERRLAPLNEAVAAVPPREDLLAKILQRIDGKSESLLDASTVVHLRRRLEFWRATAIAASAIAAGLILFVGVSRFSPTSKQPNLVAVLQKDASSPAFLVTVNIDDRLMTVQPIAAEHPAGKSYELWIVQDSLGAPKSLGVIDQGSTATRPTLAAYKPDVIESATYAVSLEPEGGSPTGKPTGPVVFAGKLVPSTR
jgi:anti-sigma-K factor RskA